jgi:hypothetical protein
MGYLYGYPISLPNVPRNPPMFDRSFLVQPVRPRPVEIIIIASPSSRHGPVDHDLLGSAKLDLETGVVMNCNDMNYIEL